MPKTNVTVLKLHDEYEADRFLSGIQAKLEACQYTPCAAGNEHATGFIEPDIEKPDVFTRVHNDIIYARIMVETRKVPDKVANAMAAKRIAKIELDGRKVSVDQQLQIMAQVKAELWENISPEYTQYWVAIDAANRLTYYFAPGAKSEDISGLLRKAFESWPVETPWDAIGLNEAVGKYINGVDIGFYIDLIDTLDIGRGKKTAKFRGCEDLRSVAIQKSWVDMPQMQKVGIFFPDLELDADVTLHGHFQFEREFKEDDEELYDSHGAFADVILGQDTTSKMFGLIRRIAAKHVPAGTTKKVTR